MQAPKISPLNQELILLILITVVGLGLRAAAISFFHHPLESEACCDELAYQSMALNLVKGNGIVDSMGNHAMYNVGYPLFVLAPVFALFGNETFAVRIINMLLGGLAILLCYAIAKEAGAGRTGRLLAAAMWALYLPASVYVVYLAKENLMIPLILGAFWCALRLVKAPSYPVGLICGVLLGLIALTGNAALSLTAPIMLALLFTPAIPSRKLSLFLVILVSALLVATPWMVRNMHVIGSPILNTNGGFNLYTGNNPAATGMFVSIADTPRGQSWSELRKEGEVQASETLKKEALAWIKEHPTEFFILALKKAAFFWTPPYHEGKGKPSTSETAVRILWVIQFMALVAFAIGSLLLRSLRNRNMALFWLAIVSYTAVHMLFYVIFRYREPIMPLLCIMVGLTLEMLYMRIGPVSLTLKQREASYPR